MAHIPPPPGVGRVGTRGCLHPKWQLLGFRHSGEVEDIHTFTNYVGHKSQNGHMTYICHMKVRFINLVPKLWHFSYLSIAGVGCPEAWYAWSAPPHHPTL